MKRSSTLLSGFLFLILAATIIKVLFNAAADSGVNNDYPTMSVAQSMSKGVFATSVQIVPNSFSLNSTPVTTQEAWIERKVKTRHPYIWFKSLDSTPDYFLCFTLGQGKEVITSSGPFFIINGVSDQSFSTLSFNKLFFREINPQVFLAHNLQVRIAPSLTDSGGQVLQFSWQ